MEENHKLILLEIFN
ncbi:hypothetical protein Patl1_21110 [Pistacia atlantica]|uniref:Uncharacterized protein n=1 Tax=Pistacia atlantica TaxID=434234 RepID=A0ACC1BNM9_9ROSI|nr:hypothetical protein Patl1_21110 [Pistacia atlantica]